MIIHGTFLLSRHTTVFLTLTFASFGHLLPSSIEPCSLNEVLHRPNSGRLVRAAQCRGPFVMRCALALQSATLGNGRALRPVRVGFRPSNARESPCGCRAFREEEENGSIESLFTQELRKRGLESSGEASSPLGSARSPPSARSPFSEDQLARSRALNSEGLEGLIPRAKQLVTLGTTFFLNFGPLIGAVFLATGAVYFFLGDAFVHGGTPGAGMPAYVDPQDLLNAPTYDPMVPLRQPPPMPSGDGTGGGNFY